VPFKRLRRTHERGISHEEFADHKKSSPGSLPVRRLRKAHGMEGNRLVHHEQRLSALLFVHAHVGSGQQISQGNERRNRRFPDVIRRGLKASCHQTNYIFVKVRKNVISEDPGYQR